ncbi:MAG: universal stress protein [Actinomycetia bacterium]|nr:universal stress protein [Actinomycetes bacterium]
MGTIVAGATDTPTANEAARQAATLARDLGARLHLVSAVSDRATTTVGGAGESWTFTTYDGARSHLDNMAGLLGNGLEVTTAVVTGDPADAMCSEAERLEADVIVVGSVRTQGISRVLGSVATAVLQRTPCAVFVAKTT